MNEHMDSLTAFRSATGSSGSTGPKIVTTFFTLIYILDDYKTCEATMDGTVGSIAV